MAEDDESAKEVLHDDWENDDLAEDISVQDILEGDECNKRVDDDLLQVIPHDDEFVPSAAGIHEWPIEHEERSSLLTVSSGDHFE